MSPMIVFFLAALVPVHSLRDDSEAEGMTQVSVSPKHFQLTSSKEKNQGMGNTALAQLGAKLQTENTLLKSIDAHTASLARKRDMQGNTTDVMPGFSMKGTCSCNLYTGMEKEDGRMTSYGSVTSYGSGITEATVIKKAAIVKKTLKTHRFDQAKTLGECKGDAEECKKCPEECTEEANVTGCEKRVFSVEEALKCAKFKNGRHNYENAHWILELTTENPPLSILWDFESSGLRMQACTDQAAMRTAEWGTAVCEGQALGAGGYTQGDASDVEEMVVESKPFIEFVKDHMNQHEHGHTKHWWYSLTKNNCQDFAREHYNALA